MYSKGIEPLASWREFRRQQDAMQDAYREKRIALYLQMFEEGYEPADLLERFGSEVASIARSRVAGTEIVLRAREARKQIGDEWYAGD